MLLAFLQDAFTNDALRRFLEGEYRLRVVLSGLRPAPIAPDVLCRDMIALLKQHGLLDPRFFEALADARPARAAEIEAIQGLYSPPLVETVEVDTSLGETLSAVEGTPSQVRIVAVLKGDLSAAQLARALLLLEEIANVEEFSIKRFKRGSILIELELSPEGVERLREALESGRYPFLEDIRDGGLGPVTLAEREALGPLLQVLQNFQTDQEMMNEIRARTNPTPALKGPLSLPRTIQESWRVYRINMLASRELSSLILQLFSLSEFRIFLLADYPDVLDELPWNSLTLLDVVRSALDSLAYRGQLNENFFRRLTEERPSRMSEIQRVEQLLKNRVVLEEIERKKSSNASE